MDRNPLTLKYEPPFYFYLIKKKCVYWKAKQNSQVGNTEVVCADSQTVTVPQLQ